MSDQPSSTPPPELSRQLQSLAQTLRSADHLDAEPKEELAALLEELGAAIGQTSVPATAVEHLRESADHVRQAVSGQPTSPLNQAQDRLGQAAAAFDARAPLVAGLVRRILDSLSNIGI